MPDKKKIHTLILIITIAGLLRFYNLMHDAPYFFNPDERNMANSISQLRLPASLSSLPICLISQIRQISMSSNCNLDPNFFAYGQFPLYLAFASDQIIKAPIAVLQGVPLQTSLQTSFPYAIFWLRFWSALSSTLTVLLVYLITKTLISKHQIINSKFQTSTKYQKKSSKQFRILDFGNLKLFGNWELGIGHYAALIAAFTPGLIQSAHFGTTESLLSFFFLASVYLSLSYLGNLSNLRYVLFTSIIIGLAIGSKLTGLFFLFPPLIVIAIQTIKTVLKRRKNWITSLLVYWFIGLLILIGSILFFILSSPYNLIELNDFKSAVFGYEADVATGRYQAFYTWQFANAKPLLFQAEKIFPYALGWPVFILGTIGFLLITLKLLIKTLLYIIQKIQKLKFKSLSQRLISLGLKNYRSKVKFFNFDLQFCILHFAFCIYLIPNAFLYAKWTRFMTPIFPFFSLFAVFTIYQIYKLMEDLEDKIQNSKVKSLSQRLISLGLKNYRSKVKFFNFDLQFCILHFAFLIFAILPGIAFMSIYTHDDSRVTASRWIYDNIPDKSYILSETANVVDIPLGISNKLNTIEKKYTVISFDFYHMDENHLLYDGLLKHLERSDYIFMPSRRIFANHPKLPYRFPLITKYYQLLFSGRLGFEKIYETSSFPQLPISQIGPISLIWNDEDAEETSTVFDHPVIRIYRKIKPLTEKDYKSLFAI